MTPVEIAARRREVRLQLRRLREVYNEVTTPLKNELIYLDNLEVVQQLYGVADEKMTARDDCVAVVGDRILTASEIIKNSDARVRNAVLCFWAEKG